MLAERTEKRLAGMSSSGSKEGLLKIRDSAGFDWEEIKPPSPPPAPSSENAHLIPPEPASEPRPLCGYLTKSTKGPIKTWKSRWFVFEDQRCRLFYYNSRNDFTPQGYINISNALFSYSVEDVVKNQFDIRADGRVHSLQASSKEAMFYWLNQLQTRRRRFSKKRKKDTCGDNVAEVTFLEGANSEGGATTAGDNNSEEEEDLSGTLEDIVPLELQEPGRRSPQQGTRSRFSFRQQITGLFRPGQTTQPASTRQQPPSYSPNPCRRSNFFLETPAKENSEMYPIDSELLTDPTDPATITAGHAVSDAPRFSLSRKLFNRVTRQSQVPNDQSDCLQCQLNKSKMEELEAELCRKEQEVKDRDAINEFLRNEIRMADMKNKVKQELMTSSEGNIEDDKKVDILLQRDQTISEYQRLLEETNSERDCLATELQAKKREVQALGEQVDLYTEAVVAKDHVVVELTNKLFQLENNGQVLTNPSEAMRPSTVQSLELELQKMKEAVEAYKRQNQFLSAELLEMNQLRSDDLAVNKQLVHDCHELEAKFIQQESKYLVLLRESQEPRIGVDAGPSPDLVSQMMEEALGQTDHVLLGKERSGSFDMYGFSHSQHDSLQGDDDLLRVRVRKNELQAHRVLDDMDAQHKLQWEVLWSQCVGTRHLQRSTHLKQLIRRGIPRDYRRDMWKWIVKDTLKETYIPGMYHELMLKHADQKSVAINQIELDLYRTLPTHKHYKADGEWINKLRRVLVAFSWYDSTIGYCQGLNRLAAIALLFLDEEDAFWCLVTIVHHHLPRDYYDRSLLGSQADQRVLKDILKERAPALTLHLASCDIDFSLITFNWFHTIFVDTMPSDTMIHIWDTFLYEGSKVLFRYAVAIFLYNQEALLAVSNSIAIFNRLRSMCKEATDVKKLTEIAFYEITRFSMDGIRKKRDFYHKQIKGEIDVLEKLRAAAAVPRSKADEDPESEEELCET